MVVIREICIDTETTGLDPFAGDRLIEIGCIELRDGKRTGEHFHSLINPERDVPEEAVNVHGITTEQLLGKPKFFEIVSELLDFLQDSVVIAHNSSFDMKFLNFELERIGYGKIQNEVIDSLMLAKAKFPGQKNSLDNLCRRYNIDNSKRTFHGALLDAELLADVYLELKGGTQKSFLEDGKTTPGYGSLSIGELLARVKKRKVLPSRNFRVSPEDQEKHNRFVETYLGKSAGQS
ncbi:MAG: DNA polymerase III subunit epsilon [Rickettsiales bacterium]|jgi:DNA polymerase-3 subunit epsilon|nr:DNA polymerase III subunit epsilon [Rickettsiales bacterium]